MHSVFSTPLIRLLAATLLTGSSGIVGAQSETDVDPIEAAALFEEVREHISGDPEDSRYLSEARAAIIAKQIKAEACEATATGERTRLEARYEPLKSIDGGVDTTVFEQYIDIKSSLDEAIRRQAECAQIRDNAQQLIDQIGEIQNQISQQFLSHREQSIVDAARDLPGQIVDFPRLLDESASLDIIEGFTPLLLFSVLFAASALAAILGVVLRHRFIIRYEKAGGDDAEPAFRLLFPKPLAEHAPLILIGVALTVVLLLTVQNASPDMLVLRLAAGITLYGLCRVIIDWSTGPLSPSASVKGLIPDHVQPLRLRLKLLVFTLVASFVFLGTRWLAIRTVAPDVPGRATMIFLVAAALLYVLNYLGRIPGLVGRFRLIRFAGTVALSAGMVALLIGYHNFAGYLIHGAARTAIALYLLWVLLWLVLTFFQYMINQDTPSANQVRRNLGVTEKASRTGLGFMQLVADLVVWLGFVVFLVYVWDVSGATLNTLYEQVVNGIPIGNIRLRPLNILSGVLIFVAMLIVIGWTKRWIDRRWLQQIVIERGAREALITIFGYVGFVIAVLVALTQSGIDLTGLAWVSGALALGIGFGMQEIANNFVSGLILLFERPIRNGDFVTVGDVQGFVRSIRIRATEIETLDNQNVLVPNSELISGRVTNWVLRDTAGRLQIRIGVAYGTDIEKVRDILEAVAREHPEVITDGSAPAPRALFMGFGDSSLDFELRVRVYRIDRRFSVQSDVNFAIDAAFREAGISIPFPQRDLHVISYPGQPEKKPKAAVRKKKASKAAAAQDNITRSFSEAALFRASVEETWQALTNPEIINRWLTSECEIDARLGGAYQFALRDGINESGHIDIYIPNRRLRLVSGRQEHEEPLATGPITTEFKLRATEEGTQFEVIVAGIPADEDWEEDYIRAEMRLKTAMEELGSLLKDVR